MTKFQREWAETQGRLELQSLGKSPWEIGEMLVDQLRDDYEKIEFNRAGMALTLKRLRELGVSEVTIQEHVNALIAKARRDGYPAPLIEILESALHV
jgi:hypothetical protein